MIYAIYAGHSVPFKRHEFTTWQDAMRFIKGCIDDGTEVHSIGKEKKNELP